MKKNRRWRNTILLIMERCFRASFFHFFCLNLLAAGYLCTPCTCRLSACCLFQAFVLLANSVLNVDGFQCVFVCLRESVCTFFTLDI